MTLIEIEKEMEARRSLAKDICQKMSEAGRNVDVALQHLGDCLRREKTTRAAASWLIINAAESVRDMTNMMADVKTLAEKCLLMPVEKLWDDDIDGRLKALAQMVADVAEKSVRTRSDQPTHVACSELDQYCKVEENVEQIAEIVVGWTDNLRREMAKATETMNNAAAKARLFDETMEKLNCEEAKGQWLWMTNGNALVEMAAMREELKTALIFGSDHTAMMANLMKSGCTEDRLTAVMMYVKLTEALTERNKCQREETELVEVAGTERDRRFAYAVNNVKKEGLIKYGYDWTWIELYCEGAINGANFSTPTSFLDYLSVLGIDSLPDRTTLGKKVDVVRGCYPDWTFSDSKSASETMRRKRVVGRFIFHYNNFLRQ